MNYLAHLLLAGEKEKLLIGNFIADHVKGRAIETFHPDIQIGIRMHRSIDRYTDSHPIVQQSILRLRPKYHKYAGVIVDLYYDHFLARGWSEFSNESLDIFTKKIYHQLLTNISILPIRSQRILGYMSRYNWLESYASLEGMQQAFTGMAQRTTFESKMEFAVQDLKMHYDLFSREFNAFFPQLCMFVKTEYGR